MIKMHFPIKTKGRYHVSALAISEKIFGLLVTNKQILWLEEWELRYTNAIGFKFIF